MTHKNWSHKDKARMPCRRKGEKGGKPSPLDPLPQAVKVCELEGGFAMRVFPVEGPGPDNVGWEVAYVSDVAHVIRLSSDVWGNFDEDDLLEVLGLMNWMANRDKLGGDAVEWEDDEFYVNYPHLYEALTVRAYPDGSSRKPSALLIFVQDGALKGRLTEPSMSLVLWKSGDTLAGLLASLEKDLASGTPAFQQERKVRR